MASRLSSARLVAIVGPTASGKSELAVEAALRFDGEIVSCDSVQVYRGLDVGSGKPAPAERARVPHHLVDILDIHEEMNAGVFARLAADSIEGIVGRGRLPIVVGGTGLYLTALLKGLFDQGSARSGVRNRLLALAQRHGPARLHRWLAMKDPDYAEKTERSDHVRIVRALEVYFTLGRPFSQLQKERRPAFSGQAIVIGLHPSREDLRKRVVARVSRMLRDGLIDETRGALSRLPEGGPMPRALSAIGYREVVARLADGALNSRGDDELQRAIVTSTMQYAKRQMTYFRHQFEVEWFASKGGALDRVEDWLRREPAEKEELVQETSRRTSG